MTEHDPFEARFRRAYRRYLDEAPTEVDALAVARRAAAQRRFGSGAWRWMPAFSAGVIATLLVGVLIFGVSTVQPGVQPAPGAVTSSPSPEVLATSVAPVEVAVIEDLVYATGSHTDDTTELELDLYSGARLGDTPIIVHVPGQNQSRKSATVLPQALAEHGATVLVVDGSRTEPEAAIADDGRGFRELVESVACAVRFARGSEYGSETAPLVLSGYSYGGGSAAHVALAGESFASLWEEYGESTGGPPSVIECTVGEASTRVDGLVGIVGTYDIFIGEESRWDDAYWLEHAPELQQMLQSTIGMHPELKVRLLAGDSDWLPIEVPATFEALATEAGYDVALTEFAGGHIVPMELTVTTIMDLVDPLAVAPRAATDPAPLSEPTTGTITLGITDLVEMEGQELVGYILGSDEEAQDEAAPEEDAATSNREVVRIVVGDGVVSASGRAELPPGTYPLWVFAGESRCESLGRPMCGGQASEGDAKVSSEPMGYPDYLCMLSFDLEAGEHIRIGLSGLPPNLDPQSTKTVPCWVSSWAREPWKQPH